MCFLWQLIKIHICRFVMTVGQAKAIKPPFLFFIFTSCHAWTIWWNTARPHRVIKWLESFLRFRWWGFFLVSVKRCVVFEQSPLLSSAVITASSSLNVVIVTYIPGKYAAWFLSRSLASFSTVHIIWPRRPLRYVVAAFHCQNKTPPLLALPKPWPPTSRLCLWTL